MGVFLPLSSFWLPRHGESELSMSQKSWGRRVFRFGLIGLVILSVEERVGSSCIRSFRIGNITGSLVVYLPILA